MIPSNQKIITSFLMASFLRIWPMALGARPPRGGSMTQMTSVKATRWNRFPRCSSALGWKIHKIDQVSKTGFKTGPF